MIILLTLVIIMTGGLIGITTYFNWAKSAEEDAIELTQQSLTSKKNYMDAYLNERIRILKTIWFNTNVQSFITSSENLDPLIKNEISNILSYELYTKEDVSAVLLHDAEQYITLYAASTNKVLNRTEEIHFPFPLPENTIPTLLPPHDQTYIYNGDTVFSIVQGITIGGKKNPHHYIIMDLKLEVLHNLVDGFTAKNGTFFIVNDTGNYVYHPDNKWIGETFSGYTGPNGQQEKKGRKIINNDQGKQLLTYVKGDVSGWTYYASIPYAKLMENVTRNKNFTFLIIAISILMAILMASFVSYRITKPLIQLKRMMTKVGRGNFTVALPMGLKDEIGFLSVSFNSMVAKLEQMTREVYLSKISETEAALKQLQAQINPHFLYNTLDSMHAMATVEGIKPIAKITESLSKLFRYSISKGSRVSTISEEIKYVKVYLEIQRIRFENRFQVFLFIDPELESLPILKFIIQPIVENAFHHGLEPKAANGSLWITVKKEAEFCAIRVTDDGVGMRPSQVNKFREMFAEFDKDLHDFELKGSHIGLMNVHRRLRLYYDDAYQLHIQSDLRKGTSVEIRIKQND